VTSSCLNVAGNFDGTLASLGCPTVPVTGTVEVTGTWTLTADGKYTDNTTTKSSVTFPLDSSCLTVSSIKVECSKMSGAIAALGWNTCECSIDAAGKCSCLAQTTQSGGIGVVSPWASGSGTYAKSGSTISIDETNDMVKYSYCISDTKLTLTPKAANLPVKGTIVLQKNGASGSGGATSSGGVVTSGGKTGSGGALGSGGMTGSGGIITGSGGALGSGGKTGSGGTSTTGGASAAGGASATGGTTSITGTSTGPCDIYGGASNKCVAAHSTVRALFGSYNGALYQVKRASDSTTKDIPVLSPGGIADSSVQDTFCTGTTCVITKVYDQSGNGNFVSAETKDAEDPSVRPKAGSAGEKNMTAANAAKEQLMVGGHKVYSLWMGTGQAYWRDGSKSGMPLGSSPQGIYMVTSGKHFGSGCCFDYGNGETSRTVTACGGMDAVNFSSNTIWGTGAGSGPWVMSDFECGLKSQGDGGKNSNDPSMTQAYVTAIEKDNGTSEYALRGADATTGNLATFFKGKIPFATKKEGAIILGSGGDCCYSNSTLSTGTFYEGAIVTGYPADATEDAVQANIVNAGYGK
jgi:hypothetical protein